MELDQARKLMDEFMAVWTSWKPLDAEVEAWVRMLLRFDYTAARRAMEAYWEECKTSKPVAAGFKAKYVAMNPGRPAPAGLHEEGNPNGYAGVSVQCVKAPDNNPHLLGHFEPLYYGTPQAIPPEDRVMSYAESLRARLTERHGGEWRIFRGASLSEMANNKLAIRQEQWS